MSLLLLFVASVIGDADAKSIAKSAPPPPAPPPPVEVVPVDPLAQRPVLGPEVAFAVPTPEVATLSNGAGVWVVAAPSVPLVTVTLTVPGGSAWDTPGKEGAAALADRMLSQGAGKRNAEQFASDVERLGIQLDVSTGHAMSMITLSAQRDKLEPALDLMADMVLRPKMSGKDFKREKGLALSELALAQDEPVAVATDVAWAAWFGKDHPYGRPPEGTVTGMKNVQVKDVLAYRSAAWNAKGARFTVAGAITPAEVKAALEPRFGAPWAAGTAAEINVPLAAGSSGTTALLVDKPGSAQTMFYLVFPGLPIGDDEVAALRTGTIALGGTFTSRLNSLLREKKGYTYGARARLSSLPKAGVVTIQTRIRTDATGLAMKDLLGELEAIRQGITDEELTKARGAYRQDQVEAMETRAGIASTFANWHAAGLGPDAPGKDLAAAGAVQKDAVTPAMSIWDVKRAVIVLVGDREKIEGPLKEAGITDIEVVPPL